MKSLLLSLPILFSVPALAGTSPYMTYEGRVLRIKDKTITIEHQGVPVDVPKEEISPSKRKVGTYVVVFVDAPERAVSGKKAGSRR